MNIADLDVIMLKRDLTEIFIGESNDRYWDPSDTRGQSRDGVTVDISAPHFHNHRVNCSSRILPNKIAKEFRIMLMKENGISDADMSKIDPYFSCKCEMNKLRSCKKFIQMKSHERRWNNHFTRVRVDELRERRDLKTMKKYGRGKELARDVNEKPIMSRANGTRNVPCRKCGRWGHAKEDCELGWHCFNCKGWGHIAKNCRLGLPTISGRKG